MTNLITKYGTPDIYLRSIHANADSIQGFVCDLDLMDYFTIACRETKTEIKETVSDTVLSIITPCGAHDLCEMFFRVIQDVPQIHLHSFYKELCATVFMWATWEWINFKQEIDEI